MAGTVALDAVTALTSAIDVSTTHTPTGTPRAVLFGASQSIGATDEANSAPVYGGVNMAAVSGSPLLSTSSTEDSAIYAYFLGSGVPTGAQTVTWDVNATGSTRRIWIITFTASGDVEVVDTTTVDADAVANVNTLTLQAGARTCWHGVFVHHALNAVANLTVTTGGWTERDEHDFTNDIAGLYTKDTNASGDTTVNWSTTANNRMAAIGVALDETAAPPPAGTTRRRRARMGVGR